MIEIHFKGGKSSINIDASSLIEALSIARSTSFDLRGVILAGEDLRGADLSRMDLSGADLHCANLSGANLSYTDLMEAKCCHTKFVQADLTSVDFSRANLCYADLGRAIVVRTIFVNANLHGAKFCGTSIHDAVLLDADLTGVNFDYSYWKLCCDSLTVKIDKRIFCQLLYHTLRAGQSVDDAEVRALLKNPEVLALANQFHRVKECGEIKLEER